MTSTTDFWTVADRVFGAHERGRYRDVLDIVKEASVRFPDRAATTTYWEACTQARLGNPSEAVTVLQEALQRGLWWNPDMLRRDPDLETIRDDPRFVAIVEACEHGLIEAQATANPQLHLYRPNQPSSTSSLLIALHWRLRRPADFTPWWLPARYQDALVAIPQSSQQLAMDSFGWDDRERATREIAEAYERVRTTEQFDPDRVILAGASQGGAVALDMALSGAPVPVRGFILVVPAIRDLDASLSDVQTAVQRGVRGWVVTGEADYGRDMAISLGKQLNELGIPCHVDVVPGLGHDFPSDFETRLPSALNFVLA